MARLHHSLVKSDHPVARLIVRLYGSIQRFTLPAPRVIVLPMLWIFLAGRTIYYFLMRTLICEPLFKAYCTRYGKGVRTGVFIHYFQGRGELIVGDNVTVDGKIGFHFAARFTDRPRLTVGDGTILSNRCAIIVGKSVSIGSKCLIGSEVWIFDSPGHPTDPAARERRDPPQDSDVKPIVIGNNVWIGRRSVIYPGVTIGDNSIIAAASVVLSDVPANTMVAGNPARRFAALTPPTANNEIHTPPISDPLRQTADTMS
jgi:acetyltransferase-like isoleucine patch superfamily enzyme